MLFPFLHVIIIFMKQQNDYYRKYRIYNSNKKQKKGCLHSLILFPFKLLALALVLALLCCALLYVLPVNFFTLVPADTNLSLTTGLPSDRVNILLLGLDYPEDNIQRSDAMLVASLSKDDLRLSSLMRDTLVTLPGRDKQNKLNAAYAYGGGEVAMQAVNETFGLNITRYAAINFNALVDIVDALGGIELEIQENEIEWINVYAKRTFKKIYVQNPDKYEHYLQSTEMTEPGTYTLDGLFATAYTRIRYADSDYGRANRQRKVLTAVLKKLKEKMYDPRIYVKLVEIYTQSVDTNIPFYELISFGEKLLGIDSVETYRAPADAYISDNGSSLTVTDSEGMIAELRKFIYGGSNYVGRTALSE